MNRLCQANDLLKHQLTTAEKKLQESEQYSAQIEVELSHLKFLKELKKYDEDLQVQHEDKDEHKKLDLGFPEDDDDNTHGTAHMNMSIPTHTNYEITMRLKTLHNLVVQYASQGR